VCLMVYIFVWQEHLKSSRRLIPNTKIDGKHSLVIKILIPIH